MKTAAELINQTSGDVEYYTPLPILEAARDMVGQFELDPFSNAEANKRVQAMRFFTKEDDGLKQSWECQSFWMNHPFSKTLNPLCVLKVVAEHEIGRAGEGFCLTYACTSERWFQPLLDRPQCFLSPRTNYHLPDGTLKKGVTKGSVVTYFGSRVSFFKGCFRHLGKVKV